MSKDDLLALENKLSEYEADLNSLPTPEIREDKISDLLTTRGLADFMPDKFAYPEPDDYLQ